MFFDYPWKARATREKGVNFLKREDGTVTIFGLLMFILMLGMGGMAVDIMRYETQRVQLQYTLDRAVLAAAALNQTQAPEDVVADYFARSGLPDRYRLDVNVEQGVNFRRVSANAEMDINMFFMDLFGVRALTSPAHGAAEERIQNVEISMVLDISGSMGWYGKLANMQTAANDFVDAVMESNDYDNDEMLVSISIVPYNGMVNAGSTIESVFAFSNEHTNSNCSRFDLTDFNTTAIDPTQPIQRIMHFDYYNRARYSTFRSPYCRTDDYGAILPWSNSVTDLQNHINSFSAGGWTAIDLGMKWAVGLLDPSTRPALTALEAAGSVHEDFLGRPVDYDDDETLKIVVLMTDGENTNQYDIAPQFHSGPSTVWYHADDDRWSMYQPSENLYWIPYGNDPQSSYGYWSATPYDGSDSEQVTWQWLWANYSARMLAGEYYWYPAQISGEWDYYYDIRYDGVELYAGPSQADTNLRAICDAARAQNILVFTIAFEAPQAGQDVMQYCATTPAHYYDVEGVEISEAFASIANTINQLKLIQ